MTNEQQQLKARFFGMHIGAMFVHPDYDTPRQILGVATYDMPEVLPFKTGSVFTESGWTDIERSQLILRPLSSITDQEAIEVASLLKWPIEPQYTNLAKDELGLFVENTIVADYLRSRNFCLPFQNFDPVAEGWAILETENQNPK